MVICERVKEFYSAMNPDDNHRHRSWEHCYQFFQTKPNIEDPEYMDTACLHLTSYLASWGMYRGKSILLQRDYKIHHKAIEKINEHHNLRKAFSEKLPNETEIKNIYNLVGEIKGSYDGNVTDTLATKILLGTLGCVPAYDRFFVNGIKFFKKTGSTLNEKNYKKLILWCKNNKTGLNEAKEKVDLDVLSNRTEGEFKYPIMKIVDMYFWTKGKNMDDKKKTHNNNS